VLLFGVELLAQAFVGADEALGGADQGEEDCGGEKANSHGRKVWLKIKKLGVFGRRILLIGDFDENLQSQTGR